MQLPDDVERCIVSHGIRNDDMLATETFLREFVPRNGTECPVRNTSVTCLPPCMRRVYARFPPDVAFDWRDWTFFCEDGMNACDFRDHVRAFRSESVFQCRKFLPQHPSSTTVKLAPDEVDDAARQLAEMAAGVASTCRDVAQQYLGMGHVLLITSVALPTPRFVVHMDGGANGWDCVLNGLSRLRVLYDASNGGDALEFHQLRAQLVGPH